MHVPTEIEQLPIDELLPYAYNSRTHSAEQVAQIAASMREFGFTNPVLIDEAGGIIAGHGRVLGARTLGRTTAPCIRLTHLTEAQRRAYVIADNKLALNAGWDEAMLARELAALQALDFDLDLTGFEIGEIDEILPDVQPMQSMPALPSGEKPPYQQMAFMLHNEQLPGVQAAIKAAKALGPFDGSPNQNGNANALARICAIFLQGLADG